MTSLVEVRRLILALIGVGFIFAPLYYMMILGLMDVTEMYQTPPPLFPQNPTILPYLKAWKTLAPSLLNSAIIAGGSMILTILLSTPAAFAVAKMRFRWKPHLSAFLIIMQILPYIALVIPLFLLFNYLNLLNTYLGVILAITTVYSPFCVILLIPYMRSLPTPLLEAAAIDGASSFQIFWRIVLPLSRPALATASLLIFLLGWGNFIFPLALIQSENLMPATILLNKFIDIYTIEWNAVMAGALILSLPPMIIVLLARKALTAVAVGGIKQ